MPLVGKKTLIVNAVIALAALYPPLAEIVSKHPVMTLQAITYANIVLRFLTKGRVSLFGSDS
jgi:hypothetical protein